MEWQPIETFPIQPFDQKNWFKGGEKVLLFRQNYIFVGYYGYTQTGKGRWLSAIGRVAEPTHWMPLPEPPSPKGGE